MKVKKAMSEKARKKILGEVMNFIKDLNKEDLLNIMENEYDSSSDYEIRETLKCFTTWFTSKKGI